MNRVERHKHISSIIAIEQSGFSTTSNTSFVNHSYYTLSEGLRLEIESISPVKHCSGDCGATRILTEYSVEEYKEIEETNGKMNIRCLTCQTKYEQEVARSTKPKQYKCVECGVIQVNNQTCQTCIRVSGKYSVCKEISSV